MSAHVWRNEHSELCPVTAIREQALADPALLAPGVGAVRAGVLAELDEGGDEEAQHCNCALSRKTLIPLEQRMTNGGNTLQSNDTRAELADRLDHLAQQFMEVSHATPPEWTGDGQENGRLGAYLRDHAYSLSEFARQVREEYVRVAGGEPEEVPTNAQGVALARFLRPQFSSDDVARCDRYAHVARGGAGLPEDYLHVVFPANGYEGGIDPEGRVST